MFRARPARRVRICRPRLEVLEDRNLLSTYVVDRLTTTGAGSGLAGDLRYCITQAADGDAITFGAGITGTIGPGRLLPTLTHSITIDGPGPDLLTIDGPDPDLVFSVSQGATVRISGLTVSHDATTGPAHGIVNSGTLAVSNCTISNNAAPFGGGIYNTGTLTISNSTISRNLAGNLGAGIYNAGTLTISSSTISGNVADSPDPFGDVGGGGIANNGTLIITNSTISDNQTGGAGGGIYNLRTSAKLTISNSILAGNDFDDIEGGSITDLGHNLIGGDPQLGPLQDNGGPTQTMALLLGSPALNAGDTAQLGVADQRGVVRSGGVNIGAYQASASAFVLTAPDTITAGTPFNVTVKAVDPFGQMALGYTGTVTFSTTDTNPAVVLPADYTFTTADAGLHTFTGGATLASAGSQTLTATDTATSSLTGSATVVVTAAAADHFVLGVPDSVTSGTAFDVTVTVVDAYGNTVTDYQGTVTFSSTDPDPGVILPADYVFMAADRGRHTFSGGATLDTPGDEIIRVTDTLDSTLTGSATVTL